MSFLAKFEMDGETMNVLDFRMSMNQKIDLSGKVSANPTGGMIFMKVESTKSTLLFDWMISAVQLKNGTITFFKRDALSQMRELKFAEGYCVEYHELFVADTSNPMQIEFVISARQISVNGSNFDKNWPKT